MRRRVYALEVTLTEGMVEEEFCEEEFDLLFDIPEEFHAALSYYAYEQSHAYGREEVVSTLGGLVDSLRKPIEEYRKNLKAAYS